MDRRKWLGAIAHLLLGILFPYVLIGGIVLVYGFMAPSTGAQKAYGAVIIFVYAMLILAVNLWSVRRLDFPSKWRRIVIHALCWAVAALASFAMLRFSE